MKNWLTGFAMCQSCFCAIPCPLHSWDEKCRTKMLLCLPILGLELGALWYFVGKLCFWLKLPLPVRALAVGCIQYFLTGFIHLDGFMDVVDALRSYRSAERRREILKDSHVGSFSVIAVVMLIAASICFAACPTKISGGLILIPVVSRCCSCLAVLGLKPMQTSQYAKLQTNRPAMMAAAIVLVVTIAVGFWLLEMQALCLMATVLGYGFFLRRGYKSLEGMNGDISGYAQSLSELCGLGALIFF